MTKTYEFTNSLFIEASNQWDSLDITNDFIFGKVMKDADLCKQLIEAILGVSITHITYPELQKSLNIAIDSKGVRFDVYVKDDYGTVFNIEMQAVNKDNLPKRSRYYQSMIDLDMIEKGAKYKDLTTSFVIFICNFDLFNRNQAIYTFKNTCQEIPGLPLDDETFKIFLNANGNTEHVNPTLKAFLDYVAHHTISNDTFVNQIDAAVQQAKQNKEWRRDYMRGYMQDLMNRHEEKFLYKFALIRKKLDRGLSSKDIADLLEEDESHIQKLVDLIHAYPTKDNLELYGMYLNKKFPTK